MSNPILERLLYASIVLLCLVALVMISLSQGFTTDPHIVYQGF